MKSIQAALASLPLAHQRVCHVHLLQSIAGGTTQDLVRQWNRFAGTFRGRARWNDCHVLVVALQPQDLKGPQLRFVTTAHLPPTFVRTAAEVSGLEQVDKHDISAAMLGTVEKILTDGVVLGSGCGRWPELSLLA